MPETLTERPPIAPRPEFRDILRDDEVFATGERDDAGERLNGWFDQLMLQSGLEIAPSLMVFLCFASGVVAGGAGFVIAENLLAVAFGAAVGFVLPLGGALFARSRRQSKILAQTPPMLEDLARAARTGRSLEQCLHLVAEETPDPLGTELRRCTRRLRMGLGFGTALAPLPERTGLTTFRLLVMALKVHQRAGGDLVNVLDRLSQSVRDRLLFLGRLRTATIASRATAVLMIVLPPGILTFFSIRDPEYFSKLTGYSWGFRSLLAAIALQIIGTVWVLRILKKSQQA